MYGATDPPELLFRRSLIGLPFQLLGRQNLLGRLMEIFRLHALEMRHGSRP